MTQGLEQLKTKTSTMLPILVRNILLTIHTGGKDPEFDKRVEAGWEKFTGVPYSDMLEATTIYLKGPPGHGKTSVWKAAGRIVADLVGLKFQLNPGEKYIPTKDDLVLVSQEMSGEISNASVGGIPTKVSRRISTSADPVEYMSKLLDWRLASLNHAGAGILLLDDFKNASENVQNVALSMAEERRFQGLVLERVAVGLTGNLGEADRTNTFGESAALITRVENYYVEDELDDWVKRTLEDYPDVLGDANVAGFLKSHSDLFHVPESIDAMGAMWAYPNPRTWSKLVIGLREIMYLMTHRPEASKDNDFASQARVKATALVGPAAAGTMRDWLYAMITEAEPVARELYEKGELGKKNAGVMAKKLLNSNGKSSDAMEFGYQLMTCAANIAGSAIAAKHAKNPDALLEGARRFAKIMFQAGINESAVSLGVHIFRARLSGILQEADATAKHANDKAIFDAFKEQLPQDPQARAQGTNLLRNTVCYALTNLYAMGETPVMDDLQLSRPSAA